ncbi:hypothetical protein [Helicobacter cetorum]|uniref:Uncharacterized protein n=1 Tax=Helicobacter cetorum (strain ATCC BAA-429 / MIT 00-7128) TaxID=182217 RepID=I0ELK6_HELC0|nr:hypothetical protein [Helicobacter cetorum]AFI03825.1 hypothetical protein HCW_02720 [Helicobacter cetorum MIT 00-7128]
MKKFYIAHDEDESIEFAECLNECLKSILKKGYIARASIGLILSDSELLKQLKEKLEGAKK